MLLRVDFIHLKWRGGCVLLMYAPTREADQCNLYTDLSETSASKLYTVIYPGFQKPIINLIRASKQAAPS